MNALRKMHLLGLLLAMLTLPVNLPAAETSASAANATTSNSGANSPSQGLANASFNFGDTLRLATSTLFVGKMPIFDSEVGITVSASLPTPKQGGQSSPSYSDVEMMLPEGGVLNLYFNFLNVHFANSLTNHKAYSAAINSSKVDSKRPVFGDRGKVADRIYLYGLDILQREKEDQNGQYQRDDKGKKIMEDVKDKDGNSVQEATAPLALFYLRNGFGLKAISRNIGTATTTTTTTPPTTGTPGSATTTTPTSSTNVNDYGAALSGYFGAGFDGGFAALSVNDVTDVSKTSGTIRIEGLVTATLADSQTVKALYPASTLPTGVKPKNFVAAWGGRLSLVITNNVSIDVQYLSPLGNSHRYAHKVFLGGVTVSR